MTGLHPTTPERQGTVLHLAPRPDHAIACHDLDAELAVLCSALLEPSAIPVGAERLRPEQFYAPAHRWIWTAILALHEAKQPVDLTTVCAWLRQHERLADVGGSPFVTSIVDLVPEVAHLEAYARIVHECWQVREMHDTASRIVATCVGNVKDRPGMVRRAAAAVSDVAEQSFGRATTGKLADAVRAKFTALHDQATGKTRPIPPVSTGIAALDRALGGGLHMGEMTVVAARPGTGKTAEGIEAAMACACAPVEDGGGAVAFFTVELRTDILVNRFLTSYSGVGKDKVVNGTRLQANDWEAMTEAATNLSRMPIYFEDQSPIRIDEVRFRVLEMKRQAERDGVPLRLVVIDYFSLVKPPAVRPGERPGGTEEEDLARVSKALVAMKKDLGVAIMLLAQLNRDVEAGKARRPVMKDLRGTGQLEQDADAIVFLWQPDLENHPQDVEAWVAKSRMGHRYTAVDLQIDPNTGRITEREGGRP